MYEANKTTDKVKHNLTEINLLNLERFIYFKILTDYFSSLI